MKKFFKGFRYDLASDDYKVVVKGGDIFGEVSKICQVEIFALNSGSWRRIQVQQESRLLAYDREGVYWKGALNWCRVDEGRNNRVIVSFDLSEEIFHQVRLVPEWSGQILFQGLKIHAANLLMYTSNDHWFMAWITNEHGIGVSWTKLFSFSSEDIPEDNTYMDSLVERAELAIYVETLVSPYLGCEPSRI
ncbi:F-box/kelch-repeat protein At3g06240-like [Rhodamnia argentea]|uniref:F-box/kelch-repeat protein At3g06240-like n=1 Tax=Rhodamnia argentea TaxID=178133 RepID=A0ABM3H6E5_9MYRT|nr:F-box/kelch-repeat protein At3g06240-like [Rhodamnia argentea]